GLVAIAAVLVSSGLAATTAKPSVRIRTLAPFSVRGTHFKAKERVTVTLDRKWVRHARASANGSFVATFANVTVNRCTAAAVVVVGHQGSRAVLKRLPALQCLPA